MDMHIYMNGSDRIEAASERSHVSLAEAQVGHLGKRAPYGGDPPLAGHEAILKAATATDDRACHDPGRYRIESDDK